MRHGIEPTIVAGTSMGALIGGAYLTGKLDAVEEWAYALTKFRVLTYLDFRVKSSGLIGGERLIKLMLNAFGEVRVEDLPHPFIAVSTDLVTGHEVWMRKGRLIDVMRASFSLPGVFPPVSVNGRWLLDGALVNPVPVSACTASGARMTIAVNVSATSSARSSARGQGSHRRRVRPPQLQGPGARGGSQEIGLINRIFRREIDNPASSA